MPMRFRRLLLCSYIGDFVGRRLAVVVAYYALLFYLVSSLVEIGGKSDCHK